MDQHAARQLDRAMQRNYDEAVQRLRSVSGRLERAIKDLEKLDPMTGTKTVLAGGIDGLAAQLITAHAKLSALEELRDMRQVLELNES
jgi:hypothetical protein